VFPGEAAKAEVLGRISDKDGPALVAQVHNGTDLVVFAPKMLLDLIETGISKMDAQMLDLKIRQFLQSQREAPPVLAGGKFALPNENGLATIISKRIEGIDEFVSLHDTSMKAHILYGTERSYCII